MSEFDGIVVRPIETAPLDGTPVILYGGLVGDNVGGVGNSNVPAIASYREVEGDTDWHLLGNFYYTPTVLLPKGWLPLPEGE